MQDSVGRFVLIEQVEATSQYIDRIQGQCTYAVVRYDAMSGRKRSTSAGGS
jgi:hypothetical protein